MNHDGVGLSIDDNPARRVSCCLFPKPVGNTLVEFQFFIVDSVGVAARSTPGQAGIRMEIEQHGHVWPAGAHCKHLNGPQLIGRQTSAGALIGKRRVDKSIAEHDRAPRQRRPYHLPDMLCARRSHQIRFGLRANLDIRAKDDLTNRLAE